MFKNPFIIVRGGGDLATGTIHRLWSSGFRVLVLECDNPSAIRRQVSVCEAVYDGSVTVEGMKAVKIDAPLKTKEVIDKGNVPVIVDKEGKSIQTLKPDIVIDAIIAKKNTGTARTMAPLTIALGPGFTAGKDVDFVIETKRGHNLGRIITKGRAVENTGIPGNIGGYSKERVIHSPAEGFIKVIYNIGDMVEKDEKIALIDNSIPVYATITGIVRGMIRDGYYVTKGFKIADIDPRREEFENCFTISDKARCIAGSVLEVVCKNCLKY